MTDVIITSSNFDYELDLIPYFLKKNEIGKLNEIYDKNSIKKIKNFFIGLLQKNFFFKKQTLKLADLTINKKKLLAKILKLLQNILFLNDTSLYQPEIKNLIDFLNIADESKEEEEINFKILCDFYDLFYEILNNENISLDIKKELVINFCKNTKFNQENLKEITDKIEIEDIKNKLNKLIELINSYLSNKKIDDEDDDDEDEKEDEGDDKDDNEDNEDDEDEEEEI